jgi:predicted RNA-binding protein YlqC (UPF0109 family)
VPDYNTLISFLLKPLLSHPDALRIDFELSSNRDRVWIRVAVDPEDREQVFGKGGRLIQSMRTVVMTAAEEAGHSARLEVFDPTPDTTSNDYHDQYFDRQESPEVEVERPRINVEKPKRREIIG